MPPVEVPFPPSPDGDADVKRLAITALMFSNAAALDANGGSGGGGGAALSPNIAARRATLMPLNLTLSLPLPQMDSRSLLSSDSTG